MAYRTQNAGSENISPPGTVSLKRDLQIIDLRHLSGLDLDPLLIDETVEWDLALDRDFSKSADLVRKLCGARRLGGVALLDRGEVAGYGYIGREDNKGLIGDVYVRPAWRSGNAEAVLLRALFDALIRVSSVRRIESQLMLVEAPAAQALQRERLVRLFERFLMTRDADTPLPPTVAPAVPEFCIEPWGDHHRSAAASVISKAYTGHIDSQMSDRYRTLAGVNRYLQDLVQVSGSATFHGPASCVAFDRTTGSAAGISLVSFVAHEVAHIAELCVVPHAARTGLGYQLLRQSTESLQSAGAKRISVTVTADDEEAVALYTRCGFRETRRFFGYVWERL